MAILFTTSFSPGGCLQNTKFLHLHSSSSSTSVKICNTRALSVNRGVRVASTDDIQYLWQWLSDEGGVSSSSTLVKPEIVPQRLGLVAQRNISQGEVVLEVPKKIWISMDTVYASEIGKLCQGLRPWVAISLFVLREKSRLNSPWRPYLNILPENLDSPMFWSEEELTELQGTQLLSSALGYKDYVRNEFLKVKDEVIVPNRHLFDSDITEEEFLWAFGILRSRAFPPLTGDNLALVPFADFVNHGFSIAAEEPSWERKGSGLFNRQEVMAMRAPAAFKAGEQVFMQYGTNKSNAQLALDYGIVERSAMTDSNREIFTLTLEISESDAFFADKLDIAELNGMQTTMYFDIAQGQGVPDYMLTFLRLIALGGTDAFLLEALFRDSVWGHLSLPVSQENEATVCKVILDGCMSAMAGYATTIEEDEALLGQQLDPRMEIAVVTRLGEKRVLQEIHEAWVLNEPHESLSFVLADLGFDVWIGNTRSTMFSYGHKIYKRSDNKFWDWKWDDLVAYDLPAMLHFVNSTTAKPILYVGFSQGSMTGFAGFTDSKIASLVKKAVMLAPIAYLDHVTSPLSRISAAVLVDQWDLALGVYEFNVSMARNNHILDRACREINLDILTCYNNVVALVSGTPCCTNKSKTEYYNTYNSQSTATRNLGQLAQLLRSGRFCKYDYGLYGNIENYGSAVPPSYDLSMIPSSLPFLLIYGGNDTLSDALDVRHVASELPGKVEMVFIPNYSHMDMVFATSAYHDAYPHVLKFLELE